MLRKLTILWGMNRSAIDKGRDKLNTQIKYQWTNMDFSFAEITNIARRKLYPTIASFRVLLNEI